MSISSTESSENEDKSLPIIRPTSPARWLQQNRALQYLRRRRSYFRTVPGKILYSFMPEIIRAKVWHDAASKPRLGPTSWMDGLRGVASIAVFTHHFLVLYNYNSRYGFGYDKHHYPPYNLPIIRLAIDGPTSVCIFFVISGYVISAKALKLISVAKYSELVQSLCSSVFRRWFRLFLPTFCIMFITAIAVYLGFFEYTRPLMTHPDRLRPPGITQRANVQQFPTLAQQLGYCLQEFRILANVIHEATFFPSHNGNLWTIPYEYRESLFIYLSLIGLCRCRPYVRLGSLVLIGILHIFCNRWEGPLFFFGAAFAQADVMWEKSAVAISSPRQQPRAAVDVEKAEYIEEPIRMTQRRRFLCSRSTWLSIFRFCAYTFALYFMSYPKGNKDHPAPGYSWMESTIPSFYTNTKRYPKSVGTLILVYLLNTTADPASSIWIRALNSGKAQYLGNIMFAFYLIHNPILRIVGYAIPYIIWNQIGHTTYWTYSIGLGGGWVLSLLLCLWAADVFNREIVVRCTRFTSWLETVCFVRQP